MSRALIGRTLSLLVVQGGRTRAAALFSASQVKFPERSSIGIRCASSLSTVIPPAETSHDRSAVPPWLTLMHADTLPLRSCSQQQLRAALNGSSRGFGIAARANPRRNEGHGESSWGHRIPETGVLAVGGLLLGLGASNRTSECDKAVDTVSTMEHKPTATKMVYVRDSSSLSDLLADIKCCLAVCVFTILGPILSLGWLFMSWTNMAIFWTVHLTTQMLPSFYSKDFQKNEYIGGRVLKEVTSYLAPFTMIKEAPLDPSVPYIFGYHPHGRGLPLGTAAMFSEVYNWFPELDKAGRAVFIAGTDLLFAVPVLGHWLRAIGSIPVNKQSIVSKLRKGDSVVIAIGGIDEVLVGTYDDKDVLFLNSRKGFCKVAIDTGAGLVPVFCFGENAMFEHSWPATLAFWKWINQTFLRLGAPFPLVGRFGLPIMHRRPMRLVFGEPLYAHEGETPAELHARYVHALCSLYKRHVADTAQPHKRLVIV